MGKLRSVPIVSAAYADDCRPWTSQDLCNFLPVKAEMEGTRSNEIARSVPGLQEFATVPGATRQRGGYVAEGRLFAVADQTLYQVMPNGSLRTKGTIPGRSRCSFAHNNATQLLIVNGSAGYIYDWTADTLTQITDDAFPGAVSAAYINHRFVCLDPSRRYFISSELDDGLNWNGLDTFQGESKPDQFVTGIVADGEFVGLSERSIEHFSNTGEGNSVFTNKGITKERGCASAYAVVLLDGAIYFIGDDGSIYEKRGYADPLRISNHAIEQALSLCNLSKAYAFTFEDKGHKVAYFTCPDGQTWGFDCATRKFHRRKSFGMHRWRLAWLAKWDGDWYGGEYNSGRVFRLDWDYHLEGSERIELRCVPGVLHDSQNLVTLNAVEVVVDAAGEATTASSVLPLVFDVVPHTSGGVSYGGGLADGAVGDVVAHQYQTIGGVAPVTITKQSGTLPAGTALDANGRLTGTYTTAANPNTWVMLATDAAGNTATLSESQYVLDMLGTPPNVAAGGAYSYTLTGTQGTAPYTFALTTGVLPSGIVMSSGGVFSGTAGATPETEAVTITMTDAAGVDTVKPYTIAIRDPSAVTIKASLYDWWTFDNTLNSVNGNNMGSGTPAYQTGKKSQEMQPTTAVNSSGTLTYSTHRCFWAWVNVQVGSGGMIFGLNDNLTGVGGYRQNIQVTSARVIGAGMNDNVTPVGVTGPTVATGRHFVVMNVDATTKKCELFVDNVSYGLSAAIATVSGANRMGVRADSASDSVASSDWIDELGTMNTRVLTVAEINYLWNSGNGKSYAEVIADGAL